jgi:hypothetical protein
MEHVMGDTEQRLDPLLERAVRALKAPVDLDPGFDRRVLDRLARDRAPRVLRFRRRMTWGSSLAGAAAVVLLVLMNDATAPDSQVRFAIQAPSARSITIVGDFNDWDPAMTPMARNPDGEWNAKLELPPGRYRYSYLVNGSTWVADPVRPSSPDSDFDAPTSLLTVHESPP